MKSSRLGLGSFLSLAQPQRDRGKGERDKRPAPDRQE